MAENKSQEAASAAVAEEITPGFSIIKGKGFHLTFDNGWTVSVQIGKYNYSDNYNAPPGAGEPFDEFGNLNSSTAEVAAWNKDGWYDFGDDTVAGYQTPAEVLRFIKKIAKMPVSTASTGKVEK